MPETAANNNQKQSLVDTDMEKIALNENSPKALEGLVYDGQI